MIAFSQFPRDGKIERQFAIGQMTVLKCHDVDRTGDLPKNRLPMFPMAFRREERSLSSPCRILVSFVMYPNVMDTRASPNSALSLLRSSQRMADISASVLYPFGFLKSVLISPLWRRLWHVEQSVMRFSGLSEPPSMRLIL